MFWDDIREIKQWVDRLESRLCRMEVSIRMLLERTIPPEPIREEIKVIGNELEDLKEIAIAAFSNESEFSVINEIRGKLDILVKDADRQRDVILAEKTLDKFDDYMKNVDKLNAMINEFKGCVVLARGALGEGKQLAQEIEEIRRVCFLADQMHKTMVSFIHGAENVEQKCYFKINAIYRAVCEKPEKKSPKRKKSVRNGVASP